MRQMTKIELCVLSQKAIKVICLALKEYTKAYSNEVPFEWQSPEKELFTQDISLESIYALPSKLKPANYCFDFSF